MITGRDLITLGGKLHEAGLADKPIAICFKINGLHNHVELVSLEFKPGKDKSIHAPHDGQAILEIT